MQELDQINREDILYGCTPSDKHYMKMEMPKTPWIKRIKYLIKDIFIISLLLILQGVGLFLIFFSCSFLFWEIGKLVNS